MGADAVEDRDFFIPGDLGAGRAGFSIAGSTPKSFARLDLLSCDFPARRAGDRRPVIRQNPGAWPIGRADTISAGRESDAVDLDSIAVTGADAVALADPRPLPVADAHPVATFDVDVAPVDGDVAAIPVDIVVGVPAVPVVVVEDFFEDDGAPEDDPASKQRVPPVGAVVRVVVAVAVVIAVVMLQRL
jgi:hypothetical protein